MGLFEKLVNVAEEATEKATKAVGEAYSAVKQGEAGEYIDSAKKKANEAVEMGKKKVEAMKLEGELEKAKTALGSLVYVMHKTGEKNEELLAQYIKDVADIDEKLEALKAAAPAEETVTEAYDLAAEFEAAAEEIKAEAAADAEAVVDAVEEAADEVAEVVEEAIDEVTAAVEEAVDVSDIVLTTGDEEKPE